MPRLRLYVLGPPRLEYDGAPIKLATRKALSLLVFLAVTRGRCRRDSLINLLWPEKDQIHGSALLRQALYALRKALPVDLVKADRDSFFLDAGRDQIKRNYRRGGHQLRRSLEDFFYQETRSRPVVLPQFIQV